MYYKPVLKSFLVAQPQYKVIQARVQPCGLCARNVHALWTETCEYTRTQAFHSLVHVVNPDSSTYNVSRVFDQVLVALRDSSGVKTPTNGYCFFPRQ